MEWVNSCRESVFNCMVCANSYEFYLTGFYASAGFSASARHQRGHDLSLTPVIDELNIGVGHWTIVSNQTKFGHRALMPNTILLKRN